MYIVDVSKLSKSYGEFQAVKDVSFQIKKGEIFGLLGPNGAGKTSTINMLIGLSRPTGGSINIDGIDGIEDIKKAQKIMGIVSDENNLYDDMDGFDNLCFCASLYGVPKIEREKRASALLEQFNLKNAGKRPFRSYSKGMRRKLTIAAGIIHEPKILFIDEFTTGIDVESARQIRNLILDLKNKGTTIFLTTHHIEDAQRLCDRVAFIVDGRIVKTGTVIELIGNSNNEHILGLSLSKSIKGFEDKFEKTFPEFRLEILGDSSCSIVSPKPISLFPVLKFFDNIGVEVYEAKEIRPDLEEVFVRITGIDAEKLRKDKEGGKK